MSSVEHPKRHRGSFGFHWVMANICREDAAWVECKRYEHPEEFEPFLAVEGVRNGEYSRLVLCTLELYAVFGRSTG